MFDVEPFVDIPKVEAIKNHDVVVARIEKLTSFQRIIGLGVIVKPRSSYSIINKPDMQLDLPISLLAFLYSIHEFSYNFVEGPNRENTNNKFCA